MIKIDQHSGRGAGIAFVHKHAAAAQEVAVPFKREVEDRLQQRVAGTNECGHHLARWPQEVLLEGDPFVSLKHGFAQADRTISIAHRHGHVSDFVTKRLLLASSPA